MAKKTEVELYEEALREGNRDAYYNLGYLYLLGQGVEMDTKKAVEYFRKGTTFQDVKCIQALAMCYKHGDGVEVDFNKMVYWLNQGVKLNSKGCMEQLAYCYDQGIGVSQNTDKAIELMKQANTKDANIYLKKHGIKVSLFKRLFGEK